MEPPFHVFLSHNSQDKPIVREIRRFLQERELRSWIDEEDLTPGRSWQEEIERILTSVPVVAVLVGQDGLGPWERPEMRVALSQYVKRRMPVIPVLLPGAPGCASCYG
jgi:superfamily I DNA/RNA helicase